MHTQEAKLAEACQCCRVVGELSNVQWIVLHTAIMDSLYCWTVRDYGNSLRLRGAATARIHMTWLL